MKTHLIELPRLGCYLKYKIATINEIEPNTHDCFYGIIRKALSKMTLEDIVKNPQKLQNKITKELKKQLGVDVRYFEIIEFTLLEAR